MQFWLPLVIACLGALAGHLEEYIFLSTPWLISVHLGSPVWWRGFRLAGQPSEKDFALRLRSGSSVWVASFRWAGQSFCHRKKKDNQRRSRRRKAEEKDEEADEEEDDVEGETTGRGGLVTENISQVAKR